MSKFVKIVPSKELKELWMSELVGRIAEVVEEVYSSANNKVINGYWVKLFVPWENEDEWFIPSASTKLLNEIETKKTVSQRRVYDWSAGGF